MNANHKYTVNPHLVPPVVFKECDPRFAGGKLYRARFAHLISRVPFKRASEALTYGHKVRARWIRLFDAKMTPQPVPAE